MALYPSNQEVVVPDVPVVTDGTNIESFTISGGATTGNLTFTPTWKSSGGVMTNHVTHIKRFYFVAATGKLNLDIDTWSGSAWNTTTKSVTFSQ